MRQLRTQPRPFTPDGSYPGRWSALVALLLAEAMNLLDATVVQVAAPAIHADLGGPVSGMQWFTTAYTLPFAAHVTAPRRARPRCAASSSGRPDTCAADSARTPP
ncbi:hypothetical protein ACGFY7_04385 [Streptomyces prunicolor]|uniref:hypothetical protein n=1 Tax=Streptomyces prunicolor TaxID=67348 RepID=UPI0037217778